MKRRSHNSFNSSNSKQFLLLLLLEKEEYVLQHSRQVHEGKLNFVPDGRDANAKCQLEMCQCFLCFKQSRGHQTRSIASTQIDSIVKVHVLCMHPNPTSLSIWTMITNQNDITHESIIPSSLFFLACNSMSQFVIFGLKMFSIFFNVEHQNNIGSR